MVLDLGERLVGSHLADAPAGGRCSVVGDVSRFHDDAAWYDALFYEYFRGDSGAADRTGWTGLVAGLVVHLSHAGKSRASS